VDGRLNEWTGAGAIQFAGATNGATAYMLWDDTSLYVAYRVTDARLSAVQTVRDAPDLYTDDAVELFIDTLNAGAPSMQPHDYQLLVNAHNVQGDLRGTGSGKDGSWNAAWSSAVRTRGTVNNNGDTDLSWSVEIAIPWAQVSVTPAAGRIFGIDLTVDDRDPGLTPAFDYFDWAHIAPANYAQPRRWKKVQLSAVIFRPRFTMVTTPEP
jgi:hypothetical protein